MSRFIMIVALIAIAGFVSMPVSANNPPADPVDSWAGYSTNGSMGILSVEATPGTSFQAWDSAGEVVADGTVDSDGVAHVCSSNDGQMILVGVGNDFHELASGDWDWNW